MAQQADYAAMQEIAATMKGLSHNICSSIPPPINNLSTAIDILNTHDKLTPTQRLDIGNYLALKKNKNQAIIFWKLEEEMRKVWLNHRLSEIEIAHQAWGFDVLSINN